MTEIEKLQAQIDELEMKQAFQDQTIEELNQALTAQQFLIDKLQTQMKFMVGKVKGWNHQTWPASLKKHRHRIINVSIKA